MFRIWCEVSGGITGNRAAWLKQNGEIATFATREDAKTEATQLLSKRNGNPHRTANFSYTVKEATSCL